MEVKLQKAHHKNGKIKLYTFSSADGFVEVK